MAEQAIPIGAAPAPLQRHLKKGLAALKFIAPVLALVLIWELLADTGLLAHKILPAPHTIFQRAIALSSADNQYILLRHIGHSMWRAIAAFLLAALVGVPLGFLLGLSRTAHAWVRPYLSLLLPLPAVAWTPIFLVTLGRGDTTIIAVCFLGAIFPILFSTIQGVQAISRHAIWVVSSMGAGPISIFSKVLLPASLPTLMTGFKLGLAHSWRTLVAAEMLAAASYGLGYMIFAARQYMDVPSMFVGIALLALLGFIMEHLLFSSVERVTVRRWYQPRMDRR